MAEIKVPIQVNLPDDWVDQIIERLRNDPEADWAEIVRCKDCKHWDKTWTNNWAKDYHYCIMVDGVRKVDFYCADAERRDDED